MYNENEKSIEVTLTDQATNNLQEIINSLSDEAYLTLIRLVDDQGGEILLEDVKAMLDKLKNSDEVVG